MQFAGVSIIEQRKPLAKWCSEKRPTLNVQSARNSLSQWATWALASANPRKPREKTSRDIFSRNINDLLAVGAVSCEPSSPISACLLAKI